MNEVNVQNQLAALLEACGDAVIGLSREGRITSWNAAAAEIYGYEPGEARGKPLSFLLPPIRDFEAREVLSTMENGVRVCGRETRHLTKGGRQIEVTCNGTAVRDENGAVGGAILVVRDVTAQSRATRELRALQSSAQNRSLVLDTASRVALDILSSRTGVEALRHIADAARILAGARYAALGVARPDGQELEEFVTIGLTPEEHAAIGPLPRGKGVLGLLLRRAEPLRLDNLADHPASVGFPSNHPKMNSFLGVPIRRGDHVLGSLYLTEKQGGGAFTEGDEMAVQALGAHAAVAIHNLHLLKRQRALVQSLIAAQEEERRAVAYDLHDGLTQFVMASHAHLESFKRAHAGGNEDKASRELERGLKYLHEAVVESRRLVNGLRSLALDDLGLAGALEQLINEEKKRAGWEEAEFIHNVAGRRFDWTIETGAYRVAQEALTNARKHAGAAQVRVLLLLEPGARPDQSQLRLEVCDWGAGFEPDERQSDEGHIGLQGMAERVNLLGGKWELQSRPGEGTLARAILPALEPAPEKSSE